MPNDNAATWWPPKPGDKLRHWTQHGAGGMTVKHVHALVHVVAVFEHEGETLATIAEWFPSRRRWDYTTINEMKAWSRWSTYWPDGESPPQPHTGSDGLLACCETKD